MSELDPNTFAGMPAPFWFVELFKGIGFFLHIVPMNLWFAGLPLAILSLVFGGPSANRFARRMFGQLPIFLALGVNFAIVPLLFLQTTYYKSFYTATILSAWYWLLVIPLFLFAYYMVYACSFAVKNLVYDDSAGGAGQKHVAASATSTNRETSPQAGNDLPSHGKKEPRHGAARNHDAMKADKTPEASGEKCSPGFRGKIPTVVLGSFAWIFLAAIGALLTHGFTLMERSDLWIGIWEKHSIAGAATGLGQIFSRPEVGLRLLTMFGLALMTTGFWAVVDAHVLIRSTPSQDETARNGTYRNWTLSFGARTARLGVLIVFPAFFCYLWLLEQNAAIPVMKRFLLGVPAIFVVGGCLLQANQLAWANRKKKAGMYTITLMILWQIVAMISYVVLRQGIQNEQVGRFVRVDRIPVDVQWSPLIVFLIVFVLGLLVIFWIVRQIAICPPRSGNS